MSERFYKFITDNDLPIFVLVMFILICALVISLKSSQVSNDREERQHALDMAQKGYCLQSNMGTNTLTYQPCGRFKEDIK